MTRRARILCRVVDNFGDAGICWRLARQLAHEHGWRVRLVIDRPELLARLGARPGDGVRVESWPADAAASATAAAAPGDAGAGAQDDDVLISAFGAEPPPSLRASLAGAPRRPLWVQLEYLSAEDWVAGCHGLRSVKPADGAVEHFYYPGFDERTGGLLRERGLFARRDAFLASNGPREWLASQRLERDENERLASLFCYPQAPLAEWFAAVAEGPRPWRVLVPESVADDALSAFFGESPAPGRTVRRGRLAVQRFAFLAQDDYDRLLWSADLNFVRGEDSWVRAQWAAQPFVWQPYRQPGDTHRVKLQAFLARLDAAPAVDAVMRAWSGFGAIGPSWNAFERSLPEWRASFRAWSTRLHAQTDLATRLVEFCIGRL